MPRPPCLVQPSLKDNSCCHLLNDSHVQAPRTFIWCNHYKCLWDSEMLKQMPRKVKWSAQGDRDGISQPFTLIIHTQRTFKRGCLDFGLPNTSLFLEVTIFWQIGSGKWGYLASSKSGQVREPRPGLVKSAAGIYFKRTWPSGDSLALAHFQ